MKTLNFLFLSIVPGTACAGRRFSARSILLLVFLAGMTVFAHDAVAAERPSLAATPPMGWNDWAHYQCDYTGQTILANARALVKSGLAARGYNTVTIDDCWMQKGRDAAGNLQADPQRFPQGMKPVADAVHAMGLKFGIYEDSGYATCAGLAGSGVPDGGGADHFLQDARLFASWGVDYLKLDGCNLYVPKGGSDEEIYRKAYAVESAALKTVGRPVVFSESAPAYFQAKPEWYNVLSWIGQYGQLWREGTDVATFDAKKPDASRFGSVLWNYAYNLPLGRFQKPGNWNDADFIIGGDAGMSAAETRSQITLWSMMSAPLILSSDIEKLSPQAIAILGNKNMIAIDQDALGRIATLVRRSPAMDVLLKPISGGRYAVAVLNRGPAAIGVDLHPADFGFAADAACRLNARNLWSGMREPSASALQGEIAMHDSVIWVVQPTASCGTRKRTGAMTTIVPGDRQVDIESYSRCLADSGSVGVCAGTAAEIWTVAAGDALESGGRCLDVADGKPEMRKCSGDKTQRWKYTLTGNLVNAGDGECLSYSGSDAKNQSFAMKPCGHNLPDQIWALPN